MKRKRNSAQIVAFVVVIVVIVILSLFVVTYQQSVNTSNMRAQTQAAELYATAIATITQ